MVPAAVTGQTVEVLGELVEAGDTLIDGGNSYYRDDIERAEKLAVVGVHYLDVGTSGGIWGLERGYCLIIGGEKDVIGRFAPIFSALAPGVETAPPRQAGRVIRPPSNRVGSAAVRAGAGHFVKMVHNGIEYALMAAYVEGLNILEHADAGDATRAVDAETAPLRDPKYYRYSLDLADIAEVWRRGSVIASWLLDLTAEALLAEPDLGQFTGRVSDSGEGRWTSLAAIEAGSAGDTSHRGPLLVLRIPGRGVVRRPVAVRRAKRLRRPRGDSTVIKAVDVMATPEWKRLAEQRGRDRDTHLRQLLRRRSRARPSDDGRSG